MFEIDGECRARAEHCSKKMPITQELPVYICPLIDSYCLFAFRRRDPYGQIKCTARPTSPASVPQHVILDSQEASATEPHPFPNFSSEKLLNSSAGLTYTWSHDVSCSPLSSYDWHVKTTVNLTPKEKNDIPSIPCYWYYWSNPRQGRATAQKPYQNVFDSLWQRNTE